MGLTALDFWGACHATEGPRKIGDLEEYPSGSGLKARNRLGCAARDQADDEAFWSKTG
jgi:hypothetical protein